MTSQPDSPVTGGIGMREDSMEAEQGLPSDYLTADGSAAGGTSEATHFEAAQDPDLIIVAEVVIDEDADTGAGARNDLAGESLATAGLAGENVAEGDLADSPQRDASLTDGRTGDANGRPADLGQQWHDIKAMFVDDPRGSVELAAAAADAAVSALVETLHQRQSTLARTGNASVDPGGTEQLREALRSYRIFCQSLTDAGQRLAQPAATAK